jgi:hypothetical protein
MKIIFTAWAGMPQVSCFEASCAEADRTRRTFVQDRREIG